MKIELKKVESDEISAMCQVAEKAWHISYDQLLPPGQVDYMVERFQSPKAVKEQINQENYVYYMVLADGTPKGFAGFAPWYQGQEEMFLSKVYLLPEVQGQGAAGKMFRLVESEAQRQGLSAIRLTVNKQNAHAIEVYQHYGFKIIDSVVTDIGEGYVMDDYIMLKKI